MKKQNVDIIQFTNFAKNLILILCTLNNFYTGT